MTETLFRHGPQKEGDRVRFNLWAPSAKKVDLVLGEKDDDVQPMHAGKQGEYSILTDAATGARYRFRIDGDQLVPDPASRFQPKDVGGPSEVIDPHFAWTNTDWKGRPWSEAVIYELHVGTFSAEGTYAGIEKHLDHLADLGFTAFQLMPIAEFSGGHNWGYDGVLPYAPESSYGRPDELKHLIDAAHGKGLQVFLDVVYNHFGPDGNYLGLYAKQFFTEKHHTPWGAAIDFEGHDQVRSYFIENALYWLEEFRFDGLRFDAVHAIKDDSKKHFLDELSETIRARLPDRHVHLIVENEHNSATLLERNDGKPVHYTAQWNDDFHHECHVLLTGETYAYYDSYKDETLSRLARVLSQGFDYQGEVMSVLGKKRGEPSGSLPPGAFINFLQNHDQVGNRAMGERIWSLAPMEHIMPFYATLLLAPFPPMLFMGDEWAEQYPFLFFTDFHDELADAVREGRRKEFSKFPAFADADKRKSIPDPNAKSTFEASKLDWAMPDKEHLAATRHLLKLRAEKLFPLFATKWLGNDQELIENRGLRVSWHFEGGTLSMLANYSDQPLKASLPDGDLIYTVGNAGGTALAMERSLVTAIESDQRMSMSPSQLLAEQAGLQTSFVDIWGKERKVPDKSIAAILKAMKAEENVATDALPPVCVIEAETPFSLAWPHAGNWSLRTEDGKAQPVTIVDKTLTLPSLPAGYHWLENKAGKTLLLATPSRCWMPTKMAEGERYWGLSAQLYSLRSNHNWGIGDFGDLKELVAGAAKAGAGVVGLNPLHALFPEHPDSFSPYSPSNRLFLNYLYIDVTKVEGYEGLKNKPDLSKLQNAKLLDYPKIAKVKRAALEALYPIFAKGKQPESYRQFCSERGEALERHVLFEALSEHFSNCGWWGEWPKECQRPDAPGVQKFAKDHAERIGFFRWLQWLADAQLAEAQDLAKAGGMGLGLYRDLAVGSGLSGAEVWQDPEAYVRGVAVGAPPDEYNQRGQNWGLPPMNPLSLRRSGYRAFIELLRANMRHASAIRIDHAFGLARLYWVPEGMKASEGVYVTYPFDEMLAVLKIESHRQCCLVIGEDLGTFPPGYKEGAAEAGLFSYRVLFFERDAEHFNPPSDYPALALATVSTHDLPTLAGWAKGKDIALRAELDLYPEPKMEKTDRIARKKDVPRLEAAFKTLELERPLAEAAPLYLAASPSALVMLQLEDLLGVEEQANLPATTNEHPNWRRRLPVPVKDIFANEGLLTKLAPELKARRSQVSPARPISTYRLQFHKGFTFHDAAKVMPYLAKLGVSHVYASPYTMARPGSTHGYDVFDHNRFNPELGGEEGYRVYYEALKANGLRQILDFVPNHMGVGEGNPWWHDVLKHGRASKHATYFDIDWNRFDGKVLLPVLGKELDQAIADGEISFKKNKDGWHTSYFDKLFPLDPKTGTPPAKPSAKEIAKILDQQAYLLAHWSRAAKEINYRRFFDINDLAGLRMEDLAVFDDAHRLVFSLLAKGELAGLRIDHIDGLANPKMYLERLQHFAGPNLFVLVEKILEPGEAMRPEWKVAGTSGYEVLNLINGVFVDSRHEKHFDQFYRTFSGVKETISEMLYAAKKQMLEISFGSELTKLTKLAAAASQEKQPMLREALIELIARFPVYRSYITDQVTKADLAVIDKALSLCNKTLKVDHLRPLFADPKKAPEFVSRFQQLSGPLMAKGLEDTAFYRYFRFISLNEVGGEPSKFGIPANDFHQQNRERAEAWPANMLATATHDTKRGEDLRARLNALSEWPEEWQACVTRWSKMLRRKGDLITPNFEYFLYQILVGSWPLEMLEKPDKKGMNIYRARLHAYFEKAMREAKQETSWTKPNEAYETSVQTFLDRALDSKEFLTDFLPIVRQLARAGVVNSYAQTLLKYTLPGLPDLYQGCEWLDFSLVDPDNRRPVDYVAREKALKAPFDAAKLLSSWPNSQLKQRLVQALLLHRKAHPAIYNEGNYQPLTLTGKRAGQAIAFLRQLGDQSLLTVIPLFFADHADWPLGDYWGDTAVQLPEGSNNFRDLLTNKKRKAKNALPLSEIFSDLPFAALAN